VAKAGLHTGECDVHPEGLTGAALDIARRVAAGAKGGDVIVSGTWSRARGSHSCRGPGSPPAGPPSGGRYSRWYPRRPPS